MRKLSLMIAAASLAAPVAMPAPAMARHHHHRHYSDGYYHGKTWRDSHGRWRCRRSDGTVGLLIGGAAGALAGRAIDTHGERATGTILGAAAGALLGREIDRNHSRCR